METQRICPKCFKPLSADMPPGLCPECLKESQGGSAKARSPGNVVLNFEPPPLEYMARLFPHLEILELIGMGGMGAVYKARQPRLDRLVALKILPPMVANDPGFAERFNREARALARLNHQNIVTVHDFGHVGGGENLLSVSTPGLPSADSSSQEEPGLLYLLMEFVDGGNLRQCEQAGQLTPEQALAIVPQICEALQFAHSEGIVHRDIKPENILLDKRGRVKITDFGIAKIVGRVTNIAPLTGVRDVVGTPHYMAPEQVEKPLAVDHRADIYSLGVVFYEMLTGELPLGKFAPPSQKASVDARVDQVVLHALEKEPGLRYQQAGDLKTAIENISRAEAPEPTLDGPMATPETETLEQQVLGRDYVLDIGASIYRGWALVRSDFWPMVGTTALVLLILGAAAALSSESRSIGHVQFTTSVLSTLLGGPLLGGLYFYLLKRIRGERVRTETAFAGFSRSLPQLFLAGFGKKSSGFAWFCLSAPAGYLSLDCLVVHTPADHRQASGVLDRHAAEPQNHHETLVEIPGPLPGSRSVESRRPPRLCRRSFSHAARHLLGSDVCL